jgi:hypothetical protein
MFQSIGSMFGGGVSRPKSTHVTPPPGCSPPIASRGAEDRRPTYSKVFRWTLPHGETVEPASVEVVGSFTDWQKVLLPKDAKMKTWHTTIHDIPGNMTHHYMLLVNGSPTMDKGCDGYALPQDEIEQRYAIQTARGPRLFMLFAQTK